MAQRTVIELVDDLDGKALKQGEGETVNFELDNVAYEIDVSTANADKFRQALAPYISAARTVSRRRGARRAGRSTSRDREQLRAIREWARQTGLQVAERGRIPAEVEEAYNAAH